MALKCFPWDPVQTYYITILQNSLNKMTWQPQWCTQNYSTLLCPDWSLLHPLLNSVATWLCSLSLQQFSSLWIDSKGWGNQNHSPIPIQLPQRPTSTPSSQLAHLVLHPETVLQWWTARDVSSQLQVPHFPWPRAAYKSEDCWNVSWDPTKSTWDAADLPP